MEGSPACGAARFSCPPHFTAMSPDSDPPRFSLEALTGPDTELWLIRAPADFAPQCLNGRRVPLSGAKTVKGKLDGKKHRYRVFTSGPQAGEAALLASSTEAGGRLACAPAPSGSLRIMEGPQEYLLSRVPLRPIPTSLPPQIPAGLRPRFSAFGGSAPVTGPGAAAGVTSPSSGKRKKRRKDPGASDTREAVEVETAPGKLGMDVKKRHPVGEEAMEAEAMEPVAELPVPSASSKKRKKSKGAETLRAEEDAGPTDPVARAEPPKGTLPSSPRKRKRQQEAEGPGGVDSAPAGAQPQVTVEPQEDTALLSPTKKRRKAKNQVAEAEAGLPEALSETQPAEHGLQGEAAPPSPKKTKKRRKGRRVDEAPALAAEVTEARPEVADPQSDEPERRASQRSPKKKKKKKGQESEVQEAGLH